MNCPILILDFFIRRGKHWEDIPRNVIFGKIFFAWLESTDEIDKKFIDYFKQENAKIVPPPRFEDEIILTNQ